ncbi:hypothetical protein [Bacillus sp. UMB0728]|uniref:hypothetical protein n=1 Tax=Bacillus sp. UMB0728 TaxID=2066052 RepID=UPI000C77C8E8|nr:hypothetical protein [Bacillus sp. UMB0728]PLR72279.1 hypothetical protein CYJ37_12035 [Bacillus sp. UMB0728]
MKPTIIEVKSTIKGITYTIGYLEQYPSFYKALDSDMRVIDDQEYKEPNKAESVVMEAFSKEYGV